jgi:hypothetical protein
MNITDRDVIRELALQEVEGFGGGVAEGLAYYYADTDADGRALLRELSHRVSTACRRELARRLAYSFGDMDGAGMDMLRSFADDVAEVRSQLAYALHGTAARWGEGATELVTCLSRDTAMNVRQLMARSIGQRWRTLNERQRSLARPLAQDRDIRVRIALFDGLAVHGQHLDPEGQTLLEEVRASV